MEAANITVDFPGPCADLPLDRSSNGWSNLGPSIFSETGDVSIPFNFSVYGTAYSSVEVFNGGFLLTPGDFGLAPFQTTIDTTGEASGTVWYKAIGSNTFAAAWDRVGVYVSNDSGPNTFQVIISDGTNEAMGLENNICFCYVDIGSADSYKGTNAFAGVFHGEGEVIKQIGFFDHPGTDYDGPYGSNDGWDYLDNQHFCFNLQEAPTESPSTAPSESPSVVPSEVPSISPAPSASPSESPAPSTLPTLRPSPSPSASPTLAPSSSGNLTLLGAIASAIISAILGLIGFVLFFFIGGSSDSSDSVTAITTEANRTDRLLF
jgi:cell division septation protein DedD